MKISLKIHRDTGNTYSRSRLELSSKPGEELVRITIEDETREIYVSKEELVRTIFFYVHPGAR